MEGRPEHVLYLALQWLGPIRDLIEEMQQEPLFPRNGWGPPGIYFPSSVFKTAGQMDRSTGEPGSETSLRPGMFRTPGTHPGRGQLTWRCRVWSGVSVPFPPPSAFSS